MDWLRTACPVQRDLSKHFYRPLVAGHSKANKLLPLPVFKQASIKARSASYQSPFWCLAASRTDGGDPLDSGGHLFLKASAQDPERWWIPKTLEHAWRRIRPVRNHKRNKFPEKGREAGTHLRCFQFLQRWQNHANQTLSVLVLEALDLLTCSDHLQQTMTTMNVGVVAVGNTVQRITNLVAPLLEQPSVRVMMQEENLGFFHHGTKKTRLPGLMRSFHHQISPPPPCYTSAAAYWSNILPVWMLLELF